MGGTTYMRHPRVAGSFYPGAPAELRAALDRCYRDAAKARIAPGRQRALGAVIPHAGYVYSGGVAAKVYARLEIPETVVILCPNHTGLGPRLSLWPGGIWVTPIGDLKIEERLGQLILHHCPDVEPDTLAHENEHAIEVHCPFLVRERPGTRIVAIVVGTHDAGRLNQLGEGLAKAIAEFGKDVLLVASSDMNHHQDQQTTLVKDGLALDRVTRMDPFGLLDVCRLKDISMCGVAPTVAMLRACAVRGAKEAVLVDHRTSGDASGDYERVVGYAGVIVK